MADWIVDQTEAQFQQAVEELATLHGWRWMHINRSFTKGYWRTQTRGNLGNGWPDLVMVKGGRLLFVELKAAKGKISGIQSEVLAVLGSIPCAEVQVWRPDDWEMILERLTREEGVS